MPAVANARSAALQSASEGPASNKGLEMSGASLQVTNIPNHVTQEEFTRLFGQAQGCIGSRLVKIGNSE